MVIRGCQEGKGTPRLEEVKCPQCGAWVEVFVKMGGAIGKTGYLWETKIVDEHGVEVPRGEVGELAVKGDGVMTCYYKNEEATNKDEDLLTTLEVVYEFYLRGFEFAPIDLYESHATKFLIQDDKILPPFVSISGLGENAAWDLMNGREGKTFLSIEEISLACPKVSKTHMQMLKEAGAFGDLPDTSQVSFF